MGVSALTGIAAASAYYYATRPLPEVPLVPLHNQSPILEVSLTWIGMVKVSEKENWTKTIGGW